VVAQVVNGPVAIHEAGLVHRDLHPANVLLSRTGQVKIADFGLIRADSADDDSPGLTDARDRLGAEAFMSPEQRATPNNVTASADFFSLGCLWYFLLTGRVFPRDSLTHFVARIDETLSSVPRRCRSLIRQLVADDPESRLQSSTELLASLSRLRRKAQLVRIWIDADGEATERRVSFKPRMMAFSCVGILAAALRFANWRSDEQFHASEEPYHQLAPSFISVPYLQSGPFSRATFFEAYPQPYTVELVDNNDAMLSNGRLITFWYFDCVGNPEEAQIGVMEGSPRHSRVIELIPRTHKVEMWSARTDVWIGE
jgi:serine/threonine protein kinase